MPSAPIDGSVRGVTVNVASHLSVAAESRPDAVAVVDQHGTVWTNRTLNDESDRAASALRQAGIERGMRTVLMVPPSLPFFSFTFALFKIGAVPVLIDPGMGIRGLGKCIAEAEPAAFVGVRRAHIARILLGWGRRTVRIKVIVRRTLGVSPGVTAARKEHPPAHAGGSPNEVAAILFTSGSTGPAKGAVYTHGMFSAQIEALRRMFDIRPGEIDLCTFPLFALFAPALGMTAIIPDMDPTRPARVNPRKIFDAVARWKCTNLFGSPAMLNALGRADPHPRPLSRKAGRGEPERPAQLPTLKRVVSAGAPVPAAVVERMQKLLAPNVPIYTPYGATECLPVACIDSATILGETRHLTDQGKGICVGSPVSEVEVAIIPVSDEPIERWDESLRRPLGEVGEIAVRGPFVSPEYFGRPDATRFAKIPDDAGGVWHRMGDLGYVDEKGRLWFCGRKAHRVWTANGPLDTICCEAIYNTHPAVFRSALVGVGPKGDQTPVICVELERESRGIDRDELTRQLRDIGSKFDHTRRIRNVLYHKSFPVDVRHNAKINREKLAVWAASSRRLQPTPHH